MRPFDYTRIFLLCAAFPLSSVSGCVEIAQHVPMETASKLESECSISDIEVVDYVELRSDGLEVAIIDPCILRVLERFDVSTIQRVSPKFQNGRNPNFAPFSHARIMLIGMQIERSGETVGFPVQLRRHLFCTGQEWREGAFGEVDVDLNERQVLRAVIFRQRSDVGIDEDSESEVSTMPLVKDQEVLPPGYKECVL